MCGHEDSHIYRRRRQSGLQHAMPLLRLKDDRIFADEFGRSISSFAEF